MNAKIVAHCSRRAAAYIRITSQCLHVTMLVKQGGISTESQWLVQCISVGLYTIVEQIE